MDKGIQLGLHYREELAQRAVYKRLTHPEGDINQSRALATALRSSQLIVWSREAHLKMSEYWENVDNCLRLGERVFTDKYMADPTLAWDKRVIRILPEWTQRSYFNFFPPEASSAVGVKMPHTITQRCLESLLAKPDLANDMRDLLTRTYQWVMGEDSSHPSSVIASPVAGVVFYPYGRSLQTATVYYPLLGLKSSRADPTNIDDYVTSLSDYHCAIPGEWCDDPLTAVLLYYHYQRMFWLESTFVERTHHRAEKHTLPGFKLQDKNEKVQIVYMRKTLEPILTPDSFRNGAPKGEGHGGWQLEFEVDVRGHERHLKSGKVVWVRPHVKGPRGVRRTRVIKAVR